MWSERDAGLVVVSALWLHLWPGHQRDAVVKGVFGLVVEGGGATCGTGGPGVGEDHVTGESLVRRDGEDTTE